MSTRLLFFLICCASLFSTPALHAQREKFTMEELEVIAKKWPNVTRTNTGLRTQVLTPGTGAKVQNGDQVTVAYKGMLFDGKVFDETKSRDKLFTFRVGRRQVIAGWDEGLQLMQVGEKRLFIIPAELAYGTRGRPPVIPRSAPLVFEVELVEHKPAASLPGGS